MRSSTKIMIFYVDSINNSNKSSSKHFNFTPLLLLELFFIKIKKPT